MDIYHHHHVQSLAEKRRFCEPKRTSTVLVTCSAISTCKSMPVFRSKFNINSWNLIALRLCLPLRGEGTDSARGCHDVRPGRSGVPCGQSRWRLSLRFLPPARCKIFPRTLITVGRCDIEADDGFASSMARPAPGPSRSISVYFVHAPTSDRGRRDQQSIWQ